MARSQFTFTFPNAQPGAAVTFSAAVYSSKVDASADGPTLVLDSQRTIAVWTDATELTATWKDGAGASIAAEASLDRPVVTAIGGTPGQPSAASSVPGVVVYTAWNVDTSAASAGFYVPNGDNFPLVLGADTGIPWFKYGDGGDFVGFYVPADAKIGAELQVLTDGTAKAIVRMTTNGLFSVNVVNPAGLGGNPDNFVHSQGIFYGAPAAFCVNQAPPGWTAVTVEVQAGAAAITSIQGQFALL